MAPFAFLGAVVLFLVSTLPGNAASLVSKELVAKLVAEHAVIAPGETMPFLVYQKIAPGWHTYWRNPGDSGQAPSVSWNLPKGVTVGPSKWPVPKRIEYGPLVNFGYADETALLYEVTIPSDWPVGRPLTLRAEAELLVCGAICIPVNGQLAIDIPTGLKSVRDTDAAPLFAKVRSELPVPSPWPARIRLGPDRLTVLLRGAAAEFGSIDRAALFPQSWGLIKHAAPQQLSITRDGLSLTAPLGDIPSPAGFSGIITLFHQNGTARSYELTDVPVATDPKAAAAASR